MSNYKKIFEEVTDFTKKFLIPHGFNQSIYEYHPEMGGSMYTRFSRKHENFTKYGFGIIQEEAINFIWDGKEADFCMRYYFDYPLSGYKELFRFNFFNTDIPHNAAELMICAFRSGILQRIHRT